MNKNNANKLQPKGFASVLFLLLSLIGAAAGVVCFLTDSGAMPQAVRIAGMAVSCVYALGALVCACCRKSGGTWLLTLTQVLMSVVLLALAALSAADLLADYLPELGSKLDGVRQLVGLDARGDSLPAGESFMFRVAAAVTALLALIHALTSFSALSALKNSYKGKYKPAATGLFGFVSLLLAAAQCWLFSLMSWACAGEEALTADAAAVRGGSVLFSDTLNFAGYTLSDWALGAWIISSVLGSLVLAFFAFGLVGKLRFAARQMVFDAEPEYTDWGAADIGAASAAAASSAAEETADAAWDDELSVEEPAFTEPEHSEPAVEKTEEDFFAPKADEFPSEVSDDEFDDLPGEPAAPAAEPFRSEPVYDDPYEEFPEVSAPAAAPFAAVTADTTDAVRGMIPGTGIFDYGYSEDTII